MVHQRATATPNGEASKRGALPSPFASAPTRRRELTLETSWEETDEETAARPTPGTRGEIGRASCRERVS